LPGCFIKLLEETMKAKFISSSITVMLLCMLSSVPVHGYSNTGTITSGGGPGISAAYENFSTIGLLTGVGSSANYQNNAGFIFVLEAIGALYPGLTVNLVGTGTGSVNSTPPGMGVPTDIACVKVGNDVTCSSRFISGSNVGLVQAASFNSTFGGWSGACTGSGACNVLMSSDKIVNATFTANPATVKISDVATLYYAIDPALDAVSGAGKTVFARDLVFTENVVMTTPYSIRLKGGYTDNAFTNRPVNSSSVIDGSLKIRSGTLRVDGVKVK
jgi:hypothetical protein